MASLPWGIVLNHFVFLLSLLANVINTLQYIHVCIYIMIMWYVVMVMKLVVNFWYIITDRTEKNATGWSKSLLESMLVDLVMEGEEGELSCALYVMYCIYLVTMAP